MTQNTFLAVVILFASGVLYPHYATVVRTWGPTPLDDQQLAAGIMWIAGDLIFLTAIMAIVVGLDARPRRARPPRADRQRRRVELADIRGAGTAARRAARRRRAPATLSPGGRRLR